MAGGIAIVGMACHYPDAQSPRELWETVLAGRRAFRRIPHTRLRIEDYWSEDRSATDCTYVTEAAVITDFKFDRARYRVSAASYRSADPAHWLALDCARAALQDAGLAEEKGLERAGVGVLVGNSLTGDYSRAASMRLRWPYVRRVVSSALKDEGLGPHTRHAVISRVAERYRRPFPEVDAETLAGWLSNTIAGRICNHFGFQGGGYAVDGACASSLLAVSTACGALSAWDLDIAIAGGVDLSLDPFELVGFARAGALAADDMRVYDRDSGGFLPGEGCGFVVLMREADARAAGSRVYAVIRGWGVSSDGQGGLTRPEVGGQTLAIERAYRRAGYGIESVGYFEGHGTGTPIGDHVELTALANARRRAGARRPAVIGTVKANIGHTKAAAGVAGLIKATMALHRQVLPPTTGCQNPRQELVGADRQIAPLDRAVPWPTDVPLRAGVSAMGFGGINTHVTLESAAARRLALDRGERQCVRSEQDSELIALGAESPRSLLASLNRLRERTGSLSCAELTDLAIMLQRDGGDGPYRVALVAHNALGLHERLERASTAVQQGATVFDAEAGVFVGHHSSVPRIAFVFPGQGSPYNLDGGRWARRFSRVRSLYRGVLSGKNDNDTRTAQAAITRAALAGLRVLQRLGIDARVAAGHSLGELVALHWSGAINESALMRIVNARGHAMADLAVRGAMASIAADAERVRALIGGSGSCIAAYNTPIQTVVAGPVEAIACVVAEARRQGLDATPLRVSHGFHSELMRPAASALRVALQRESVLPVGRCVYSTVTAARLSAEEPLIELLTRQLVEPVRFTDAAAWLVHESDLAIEVGPGSVLAGLMRACGHRAVVWLDAGGASLAPLMRTVGAAYVLGAPVQLPQLAAGRFARPFRLDLPSFLASPCEQGLSEDEGDVVLFREPLPASLEPNAPDPRTPPVSDPLAAALEIVADRAELPVDAIRPGHRLLADLHFNSITAAQIVLDVAARLDVAAPPSPTEFADASIEEVVEALTALGVKRDGASANRVAGVDSWVRTFRMTRHSMPARIVRAESNGEGWRVCAPEDHPLRPLLEKEAAERLGSGTIVCLPSNPLEDDWLRLATAARDAARRSHHEAFVIAHDGDGGVGLGASLALEAPQLTVVVVQVPFDIPEASRWILDEAAAADRFTHVCLTPDGARHSLQLEFASLDRRPTTLDAGDVLVVSGGGKGIAVECALALAKQTGAALGLIGRADPATDPALAAALLRMSAAGARFRYERADVGDRDAVKSAMNRLADELGSITGILHAAGVNRPTLLAEMTDENVREAFAAKVAGARHLVEGADMRRVRLFVAFGSLIARTGMRGDAHYALANDAMRLIVDQVGAANPDCRCLTIEWSVWAGAGMGERLGRLSALERQGIVPLTIDQGVEAFVNLVSHPAASGSVVVSSRFGDTPALKLSGPPLPLARFLEKPRVFYPGLELVADSELSTETDAYLDDHAIDGERLFPAAVGLEAMVQAAAALTGAQPGQPWQLHDVRFDHPIVVPLNGRRVVRVAALARSEKEIDVALRTDATGFAVDHFALRCRFGPSPLQEPDRPRSDGDDFADSRDLYDELLFQRGRFQRVSGYRELRARSCVADVSAAMGAAYFGTYHPARLWLGDPGVRDAVIHAIQACIPLRRLVPVCVDRLMIAGDLSGGCRVEALERGQHDAIYIYDVIVRDALGRLVERWEGLHLRDIGGIAFRSGLPALLLEPWLEREWQRAAGDLDLKLIRLPFETNGSGLVALRELCSTVLRRPDGRPDPMSPGLFASATHDAGTTVGVVMNAPVGCDLECVRHRKRDDWEQLLGASDVVIAQHVMQTASEPLESSATRIWSAREALRKCGVANGMPLILTACDSPVVRFRSGAHLVTTTRLRASEREMMFAMVVQPNMVPA